MFELKVKTDEQNSLSSNSAEPALPGRSCCPLRGGPLREASRSGVSSYLQRGTGFAGPQVSPLEGGGGYAKRAATG